MSDQTPLFRVIGPDGEEDWEDGEVYVSPFNHLIGIDDFNGVVEPSPGHRVEFLRDPRPIAAEVHAVVEAAERWARCPGLQAADKLRDAVRTLAAKEGENG